MTQQRLKLAAVGEHPTFLHLRAQLDARLVHVNKQNGFLVGADGLQKVAPLPASKCLSATPELILNIRAAYDFATPGGPK
jgi:hypothetical protein